MRASICPHSKLVTYWQCLLVQMTRTMRSLNRSSICSFIWQILIGHCPRQCGFGMCQQPSSHLPSLDSGALCFPPNTFRGGTSHAEAAFGHWADPTFPPHYRLLSSLGSRSGPDHPLLCAVSLPNPCTAPTARSQTALPQHAQHPLTIPGAFDLTMAMGEFPWKD